MTHKVTNLEVVTRYLEEGGLGEVLEAAADSLVSGSIKVQMDTDMAYALCLLADEALKLRARGSIYEKRV